MIIAGAKHIPPEPFLVREKMEEFINWYNNEAVKLHPLERAALDKAHTTGDNNDFIELIKEEINKALELYLKFI